MMLDVFLQLEVKTCPVDDEEGEQHSMLVHYHTAPLGSVQEASIAYVILHQPLYIIIFMLKTTETLSCLVKRSQKGSL